MKRISKMAKKHPAGSKSATESVLEGGESAANTSAVVFSLGTRMMEQSADQFSRLFGATPSVDHVDRQSNRVSALQECGSVAVNGYHALSQECLVWMQNQIQAHVSASVQFMRSRSPQEFAAAQNKYIGESLALALKANSRLAGILNESADRAADSIAELDDPDKNGRHRAA
jgi:hypothetical protein